MESVNEVGYKFTNVSFELWSRGYSLHNISPTGDREIYDLFIGLYEQGTIQSMDDFLEWILVNKPELVYNRKESQRKYREENEPKIRAYFAKYIEGRPWDEIDPQDWEFYSDWHKDVFGYRPHAIVCGEYVNPRGKH